MPPLPFLRVSERGTRPATLKKLPLAVLAAIIAQHAGATLTVVPSSVTNAFKGVIDLTITGLNNSGQTVIVEKFFDANASGAINSSDLLVQRFKVTDGQVTSIGGQRNLNVPGDEDRTANSSIHIILYLAPEEIVGRIDGLYIFRVSPDGSGFSPFTANLTVTQADYGGSGISGKVMGSGSAQARALVMMTIPGGDGFDVAGITIANASGNYSLKLPPKTYSPVPIKTGFVFDTSTGPQVTVSAAAMASSPDAVLTVSSRTIAGTVRDEAAGHPVLPGMGIFAQSQTGMFSFTFSDASGNYMLDAAAGRADFGVIEQMLPILGMVGNKGFQESSAGSVTGFPLEFPRATALIYGTVRTPASVAVPYINVEGGTNSDPKLKAAGITDAAGNYSLGVVPGSWQVRATPPGYLISEQTVAAGAAGSAVEQSLTAYPISAHLRGQVKDNHGNPVANVEILAHDYAGANSIGVTDSGGNFDLGVYGNAGGASKRWSIQLSQGDNGDPSGYVSSSADFQVVDGTDINNIIYLVYTVTAHIRGQVLDENSAPLGGFSVFANAQSGNFLAGTSAQGDGTFDLPVFANTWKLGLSNITGLGLLTPDNLTVTVVDGVDRNGIILRAHHSTGTFSGTVKNSQGTALGGIQVSANITITGDVFSNSATTDPSGHYSIPVFSGTWSINADSFNLQSQGYLPTAAQSVSINAGNVAVNFVATTTGQTFASWKVTKFSPAEAADPALSGPLADFDSDGIVNLMEYALHLEPKTRDIGGLPVPGTLPDGPGGSPWATLTFRRLVGSSGLSYSAEASSGLPGTWEALPPGFYEVLSSDGTVETVRVKAPVGTGGRTFLRLKVAQTP
jgi:hypothetical protein